MKYEDLVEWISNLEQGNKDNKELLDLTKNLRSILVKPWDKTIIPQLIQELERIVELDAQQLNSVQEVGLNYLVKQQRTGQKLSAGIILDKLRNELRSKSINEEQEKGKRKFENSYPSIGKIFRKFQDTIQELEDSIPDDWHQAYIEHRIYSQFPEEKRKLPQMLMNTKGCNCVGSFIQYLSYNSNFCVTPDKEIINPFVNSQPQIISEKVIEFSKKVYENNKNHQNEVNHFVKNAVAVDTLNEIKNLIERTEWKLGRFGSRSKIVVDGSPKQVPENFFKIYTRIEDELKNPSNAKKALEDIHAIAEKAKIQKPFFLPSYRKRDATTQKGYEEIAEQTKAAIEKFAIK